MLARRIPLLVVAFGTRVRHACGVRDTIVFIPAWNEAASLPALLEEARRELPEADLLVIDDGSTDDTAAVSRAGGAQVVSFPENHGLRHGIAEGYRQASSRGYELRPAGRRRPAPAGRAGGACSRWCEGTSAT